MTTFTMTITIDQSGVKRIKHAYQYVTLARKVDWYVTNSNANSPPPAVAWLVREPVQNLTISWSPNYYLYATSQDLEVGTQIIAAHFTRSPALSGYEYKFSSSDFTRGVSAQEGTFAVNNQAGSNSLKFGLMQDATIGLVPTRKPFPLIIAPVLNNETASFTPHETVYVFLQSYAQSGVLISEIPSKACAVTLTDSVDVSVGFNDSTNTFHVNSASHP